MSRDWEDQFREWAEPPGKTEQERCDNAETGIRNAIEASQKLQARMSELVSDLRYLR